MYKLSVTVLLFILLSCQQEAGYNAKITYIKNTNTSQGLITNGLKQGLWIETVDDLMNSVSFYENDTLLYKLNVVRGVITDSIDYTQKRPKQYVLNDYNFKSLNGIFSVNEVWQLNFKGDINERLLCNQCHKVDRDMSFTKIDSIIKFIQNYKTSDTIYNDVEKSFLFDMKEPHSYFHSISESDIKNILNY